MTLDFLKDATNVVLVGQNGTGKTMLAQNIAHQALIPARPRCSPPPASCSANWQPWTATPHCVVVCIIMPAPNSLPLMKSGISPTPTAMPT